MVGLTSLLTGALCCLTAVPSSSSEETGPFDMVIKQMEACEDEGTGAIHFPTRINHAGNKRYTYNSPFTIGLPIDNNMKTYMDVQQWGNGGYRPRAYEYTAKNCIQLWKILADPIKSLFQSAGLHLEGCPIPAGNYTANNWDMDVKLDHVRKLPYNKYRIIVKFSTKGVKVGCQIIYADIVPKSTA